MKHRIAIMLSMSMLFMNSYADSFKYNSFNNHGTIGLINIPSSRFYGESSYGITAYDGTPDQKMTMTSFPYNWMEASFFYTNIQGKPYCGQDFDLVCRQDYKDKGFNFKLRLKEEGVWPAFAIGINDIAGTGLYSSEYIVGSYGINRLDFHFGLGWGNLSGGSSSFKNPFIYLTDSFSSRPEKSSNLNETGKFEPGRYFSGKKISPFFGLSYAVNEHLLLKLEHDPTLTPGLIGYQIPEENFSFGIEYTFKENFNIGLSSERGNYSSLRFSYKKNPKKFNYEYKYKKAQFEDVDNKYTKLIKSIEANDIGVNKIIETPNVIGLELTQFTHPNLDIVEEIIRSASYDAGIDKVIKKDLRIANLQGVSEYNKEFERNSLLIYQRKSKRSFSTKTNFTFRPYLASREDFFKGALLLENNSELIIKENIFFSSNLKYSIADNFEDLTLQNIYF